jgi:hypothetical protein
VPVSDERLTEIEARVAAAKCAPWRALHFPGGMTWRQMYGEYLIFVSIDGESGAGVAFSDGSFDEANAEFIAHARQDVPALVREVRRLRRQLRALDCVTSSYRQTGNTGVK